MVFHRALRWHRARATIFSGRSPCLPTAFPRTAARSLMASNTCLYRRNGILKFYGTLLTKAIFPSTVCVAVEKPITTVEVVKILHRAGLYHHSTDDSRRFRRSASAGSLLNPNAVRRVFTRSAVRSSNASAQFFLHTHSF